MLVLSSYFRHSLAHRHMCQATRSAGSVAFCFLCLPSDFSVEIRHSCHGQLWGAELSTFRLGGKHLSHETFHFQAITIGGVCQCSRFRNEAEKILQLNKMKVIEIVPPQVPQVSGFAFCDFMSFMIYCFPERFLQTYSHNRFSVSWYVSRSQLLG